MARRKRRRELYEDIQISISSKNAFREFADKLMDQVHNAEIDPRDAVMIMSGYAYSHGYIDAKMGV